MNIDLRGKNAMVCGSTQGIGKAIADKFAAFGANVTLIARNELSLQTTLKKLPNLNDQRHSILCADFSYPADLKMKIEKLVESSASCHILVNNSGGPPVGETLQADSETFLEAFNQHLLCSQILTQAVVPGMKSENYGRIINIISTSVKQPIVGLGVSNAIRGAVASWAKTLSLELAPYGITVNNVLPGATKTQRLKAVLEAKAQNEGRSATDVENAWKASIPARRFAEPEEVANAAAFLASPAASYINGINLPVDGGRTGCL